MEMKEIEKSLEDAKLSPYGINNLMQFVNGNVQLKKNGNLKITIEFPSEVLKSKGVPFKLEDFNLVPLVLFCKHKED